MFNTNFDDVRDFHMKFQLPIHARERVASLPNMAVLDYRLRFLREELNEVEEAINTNDLAAFFDALIDLAWVAMGTAHYAGLPWQAGWDEVARANLAKVRASESPAGAHKPWRGAGDIVKPEGWIGPRLREVIATHNSAARLAQASGRNTLRTRCLADVGGLDDSEGGAP